jgi:hypothetical protein
MFGALLKWLINIWIALTGRVCKFKDYPWLEGPMSENMEIGSGYYDRFAQSKGYKVVNAPDGGLLNDFTITIPDSDPLKQKLNPRIARFYENTVQYKLEVWSQWYAPIGFFARILIRNLSTKMNQLNIPLEPLETSRGMSNEVLRITDPITGALHYACWLRKSILTGKVVYAGFYSTCSIDGQPYVRVVFPLPDGNVTVVLKSVVQPDGSVKLLSGGKRIGEAGYYRVRKHGGDAVKVKYIPLTESIHVFEDEEGTLRTDHEFWFVGFKLLHLHYKIMER